MSECNGGRCKGGDIGTVAWLVIVITMMASCQSNERLISIERHLGIGERPNPQEVDRGR